MDSVCKSDRSYYSQAQIVRQYLDNDKEIKRLTTKNLTVSESENED